jgi:hypothetical protein
MIQRYIKVCVLRLSAAKPTFGILFFLTFPDLELQHRFPIVIRHYFSNMLIHSQHLTFFNQYNGKVSVDSEVFTVVYENGLTLAGNI